MRGDHHIWVRNSEYNRVSKADKEAHRRKARADAGRKQANEEVRRVRNEMNRLRRESDVSTQQVLDQIQTAMNVLFAENETLRVDMEQELLQYIQQTQQQMADFQSTIADVAYQAEEIDRKIDTLSAEVAERFRVLTEAAEQEKQRAQLYVNQYALILQQIHVLHPERLTPGEVEQNFDPVIGFLEMNMANGDYQAAIGVSQTKMPEALAFHLRLEVLNAEYEDLCDRAEYAVETLTPIIQHLLSPQENARRIVIGDGEYEYNGDLMYWTNELLQLAVDNFENTCRNYETAEFEMDLDQLRHCLDYFNQIDNQLTLCEMLAEEQFRLFGGIGNLASAICASLTRDEAWTLAEEDFMDQDMRRSYRMSYVDGDGNTVSFVLLPNREISPAGEPGEIQFLIDVTNGDGTQDHYRCRHICSAVLSRLMQDKIEIGATNRNGVYCTAPDKRTFLSRASAQGDQIKEERLEAVRVQLQLS